MDRWGDVFRKLLLLSSLWGLGCGLEYDGCKNHDLQFDRVFSVPGEVAMLNSSLLSYAFFNLSAEPYNITWYRVGSDQPISNQSGQVLVVQESLWVLNVTLANAGRYVTVVRTPRQCFRLETELVVDLPLSQCERPRMSGQLLTKRVTDKLSCPLKGYISKLRRYGISYDITWYKGCELISDGAGRLHYWDTLLKVEEVELADQGLYTCTLHFNMGGVRRRVSETIDVEVKGDYYLLPEIHEPAKDVVRAELGSSVTKRCLVFVSLEGKPYLDVGVYWLKSDDFISDDPNQRVYATQTRFEWHNGSVLIDRWLVISELKEQDLNLNYTCKVWSGRGSPFCYFTLLYKEPELLVPVSLVLGSCLLLFLLCVSVYHVFKLELVLWFRQTFPMLYSRSGSDGKLYDAYVAFPQRDTAGWTLELERFALHTLPQVLEEACGYSLFIPDRDSLPGEAVMDSVEENLKVSRRIILLYTASTFSHKYCSNNNNTLLSRPMDQTGTGHHSQTDHLTTSKENLNTSKEHLNTSKEHLNTGKEHLNTSKENLNISKEHLNTNQEHLNTSQKHLNTSKEHLNTSQEPLNTSQKHLNTSKDHLNASKELLTENVTTENLTTRKEHLNITREFLATTKENLNSSREQFNTSQMDINITNNNLNSRKVHFCPSEDPNNDSPLSCEDTCGHARTQLECVAAMHRALLERSLKVILVELEELGPSDLKQLPESLRHLRQTKGAVCWWRTRGAAGAPWMTGCTRRTWDTDTTLSSCVSPNCRFWKEVRYKMPVKGKRTTPPEDTALLHLHRTETRTRGEHALPV